MIPSNFFWIDVSLTVSFVSRAVTTSTPEYRRWKSSSDRTSNSAGEYYEHNYYGRISRKDVPKVENMKWYTSVKNKRAKTRKYLQRRVKRAIDLQFDQVAHNQSVTSKTYQSTDTTITVRRIPRTFFIAFPAKICFFFFARVKDTTGLRTGPNFLLVAMIDRSIIKWCRSLVQPRLQAALALY